MSTSVHQSTGLIGIVETSQHPGDVSTQDWSERFTAAFPEYSHLRGGNADEFDFAINRINLIGGQSIPLQRSGVTAIVGANNAGKSTVLPEVWEKLSHMPGQFEQARIAVDSLELHGPGCQADPISWLGQNASFVVQGPNAGFQRGLRPIAWCSHRP